MFVNTVIAFIIIFGTLVFSMSSGIYCSPKERESFAVNLRSASALKSFHLKRMKPCIRSDSFRSGVRPHGLSEDPEMIEVKPGYTVGLLFNKDDEVEKVIINQKEKYPDALIIEVETADLEHEMKITGYEQGKKMNWRALLSVRPLFYRRRRRSADCALQSTIRV